jgi:hypothetical protein
MAKKLKNKDDLEYQLSNLSLAERALMRRAVYEHPTAIRVDEAGAGLAEELWRLNLLRPSAIGQRYCWRLNDRLVARRSLLRQKLFPE